MSLTHAQEIEFKEAFALFDPTNSGVIQPKAFADFVALLNNPELTASVKLPTQPLDFKAFSALLAANHKGAETSDEAYSALFKSINKDGSGNLSSAELRSALQHFGNSSLSEADVDEIVHEADVSGDGRISYEEFLKIMQKSEKKLRGEHIV
ncbi:calmodulin-like 3 [Mortierella sp. GBA35]|nr:calmodulin-like 3 [Mortierella sp. AD031]KAF9106455.1 calmodulin-like 3 [Mortierella sp. GBA35]KAG0215736.1 calmodulin-like 3 [Mortierella sp. NVP41]